MSKVIPSVPTPPSERRADAHGARAKPRPAAKAGPLRSKKPLPTSSLGRDSHPTAQRRAAAILEVLAGEQTVGEAARVLGISPMHYYLLERRALQALVAACAPRPKGPPGPSPEQELTRLRRDLDRSRRECLRQAALVRATQRAIGFPIAAGAPSKTKDPKGQPEPAHGKRSRRRRATVRALRAAQTLRQNSSGPDPPDVVERSPLEGNGLSGTGLTTSPAASDKAGRATPEAGHGTQGQEAGRHGTCGAAVGIGGGQAAADDVPGDARG